MFLLIGNVFTLLDQPPSEVTNFRYLKINQPHILFFFYRKHCSCNSALCVFVLSIFPHIICLSWFTSFCFCPLSLLYCEAEKQWDVVVTRREKKKAWYVTKITGWIQNQDILIAKYMRFSQLNQPPSQLFFKGKAEVRGSLRQSGL